MAPDDAAVGVTVYLQDVGNDDSIPKRCIVLKPPHWEIKIGRGTLSGDGSMRPTEDNALFDSRVMSRNHAKLRGDPETKRISVVDIGSTHGTHLHGRKLKPNHHHTVGNGDIITFGVDVTRASLSFNALKVKLTCSWLGEQDNGLLPVEDTSVSAREYRNTFSADYSEEELYDELTSDMSREMDEDVARFIPETAYAIVPDGQNPSCSFTALGLDNTHLSDISTSPDISAALSYVSDEETSDGESPTSDPVDFIDLDEEPKEELTRHSVSGFDNAQSAVEFQQDDAEQPATGTPEYTWPTDSVLGGYCSTDADEDFHANSLLHLESPPIPSILVEHTEHTTVISKDPTACSQRKEALHRAPSPSDAAMVKPSAEDPPFAPPFIQHTRQVDTTEVTAALEEPRSTSFWAGHNSVLYDPVPCDHDPSITSSHAVSSSGVALHHLHGLDPDHWTSTGSGDFYITLAPLDPSRVSFTKATIEGQPFSSEAGASRQPSLKRKADQSSPDADLEACSESPGATTLPNRSSDEIGQGPEDRSSKSLNLTTEADVDYQARDTGRPLRKKARKNKYRPSEHRSHSGTGFFQIAAATIAGMAIGAVGTVLGLAALPPLA